MKRINNKFVAVCIYFAPYLIAVACIALYAVVVNLIRVIATDEMVITQSALVDLLTYLPISVAFILLAITASAKIREKVDLSVIGIKENKRKNSKFSFIIVAISLICIFVSVGFASSYASVKVKNVGGSLSYYIVETGFMGIGKSESVITKNVDYEYDGKVFTVRLKNGKTYKVNDDTKAGKLISQLLLG